jgi:hypothetical protein
LKRQSRTTRKALNKRLKKINLRKKKRTGKKKKSNLYLKIPKPQFLFKIAQLKTEEMIQSLRYQKKAKPLRSLLEKIAKA